MGGGGGWPLSFSGLWSEIRKTKKCLKFKQWLAEYYNILLSQLRATGWTKGLSVVYYTKEGLMLNWNDLKKLQVVKKTRDIIFQWWKTDVLILERESLENQLSVENRESVNFPFSFQNPLVKELFEQESIRASFFEKLNFVQKQKISSGVLEKWPSTGLNLFIVPVQIQSYTAGVVAAVGFKYSDESTEHIAGLWSQAGLSEKKIKQNKELIPCIPAQDKTHFMDLMEMVRDEIVSVQQEFMEKTHKTSDLGSDPHSVSYGGMVGQSNIMHHLYNLLDKIKHSHNTILIQGENGTGKELIAKSIHQNSLRKNQPFIAQNCSALNDNLLESELFGHIKGSFTGAYKDKKGLFEMADQGSFFLDEVGDTSPAMQVKLLRVLQEGSFFPVGGTEPRKVDVRIIAATNRNLKKMVEEGHFREDLYYRLNVINIQVPPLRERVEDIPLLAEFFINRFSSQPKIFTRKAQEKLKQYPWPGNVRELQNEAERLAVFTGNDAYIKEEFLSEKIRNKDGQVPVLGLGGGSGKAMKKAIAQLERQMIAQCLKQESWNKTKVAKKLGISRAALVSKVKDYKLEKRVLRGAPVLLKKSHG